MGESPSAHPGNLPGYDQLPPRTETYGLTSQVRRASSSICANLAEGCGRDGDAELARFCNIARGSASELEYHLLLARDLQFLQAEEHDHLANATIEVKRMLTALSQKLNALQKLPLTC